MDLKKTFAMILILLILIIGLISIYLFTNPELIPGATQILTIIGVALFFVFLCLVPFIMLILGLMLGLQETPWKIFKSFFLLIFPWLVIVIGLGTSIQNIIGQGWTWWYYIIPIVWFGYGILLFDAIDQQKGYVI